METCAKKNWFGNPSSCRKFYKLPRTQPPVVVKKWKLSWNVCKLHTCFCIFGTGLHAQSMLINKISALEPSRKFIKSAFLVGNVEYFPFIANAEGRKVWGRKFNNKVGLSRPQIRGCLFFSFFENTFFFSLHLLDRRVGGWVTAWGLFFSLSSEGESATTAVEPTTAQPSKDATRIQTTPKPKTQVFFLDRS